MMSMPDSPREAIGQRRAEGGGMLGHDRQGIYILFADFCVRRGRWKMEEAEGGERELRSGHEPTVGGGERERG